MASLDCIALFLQSERTNAECAVTELVQAGVVLSCPHEPPTLIEKDGKMTVKRSTTGEGEGGG